MISTVNGPFPALQVALDFLEADRALALAREAVEGGADWLEAGTPLLKSEGLEVVRRLRALYPQHVIVADLKTMDAGRVEVEAAARAGASVAVCLAAASDATIVQCVETGRRHGVRILVDTIGLGDAMAVTRAQQAAVLGAHLIGVHCPVDEQMLGKDPLERLRAVAAAVDVPVAVAGGVTAETAAACVEAGASVVVVGGALHKAPDAAQATRRIKEALAGILQNPGSAEGPGRRFDREHLADALLRASVANLSDACHHLPALRGVACRTPGLRMAGPAVTVRTAPGDWNRPVRAIDEAPPGSVVVVDAGGVPPAVWGGLATFTAKNRGLAGVVVHGMIRDVAEATRLGLPLFSAGICPDAGDPKGLGEIGGQLAFGGQTIQPGDWIVGDDDGVLVLPARGAVEYANRALDVAESEGRLQSEIARGATLAELARLDRWDRKG